ncbi:hypothetical protein [Winogradskyella sp. 3972H.M.0a.05]|uniref:hypothetical protein n=1 Tax=Winogradskyella sp. 3972H.M.0a.05 TaxID=2950277 RepID=UPI003397B085
MRTFSIVFTIIAIGIIVLNATKLNFDGLFEGESLVACITILAALCALALVWILNISKQIQKLSKGKPNV